MPVLSLYRRRTGAAKECRDKGKGRLSPTSANAPIDPLRPSAVARAQHTEPCKPNRNITLAEPKRTITFAEACHSTSRNCTGGDEDDIHFQLRIVTKYEYCEFTLPPPSTWGPPAAPTPPPHRASSPAADRSPVVAFILSKQAKAR
jgi:hypothetical protein